MDADSTIDEKAIALAKRAVDSDLGEAEVRWRIAALLTQSSVPERVAYRDARFYGRQAQLDYAEHLRDKLLDLIVGKKCDIQRIADGASLSGWMYAICSSTISKMSVRQVVQPHNKRSHTNARSSSVQLIPLTPYVDVVARDDGDRWYAAWENAFTTISPSTRLRNAQIHLRSKILVGAYHLSPPRRGVFLTNREALLNSLDDPQSAHNDTVASLRAERVIGLATLWPNQLDAMADVPTMVTHALALAALTPISPPTLNDLKEVRNWMGLPLHQAGRLVRAFACYYSETRHTEYSHKPLEPKTLSEHLADADTFNDEAAHHGDPIVIYERLCDLLAEVERSRFTA